MAVTTVDLGNVRGPKGDTGAQGPAGVVVRNLLDNSDFCNVVNQRGTDSYSGAGYTIDRWKALESGFSLAVGAGGVTIDGGSLLQVIPDSLSGMHTLAAMTDAGVLHLLAADMSQPLRYDGALGMGQDDGNAVAAIGAGSYIWAALYEGDYTADSLPPYVAKGYAAELAQCQRYYYRLTPVTSSFPYAYGYCYDTAQARLCLRLPQPMVLRNPTFLYTAGAYFRVVQNGTSSDITELSLNTTVGNRALLHAAAGNLSKQHAAALMLAGGVFEFSADL